MPFLIVEWNPRVHNSQVIYLLAARLESVPRIFAMIHITFRIAVWSYHRPVGDMQMWGYESVEYIWQGVLSSAAASSGYWQLVRVHQCNI